jgi:hypothetical protein
VVIRKSNIFGAKHIKPMEQLIFTMQSSVARDVQPFIFTAGKRYLLLLMGEMRMETE